MNKKIYLKVPESGTLQKMLNEEETSAWLQKFLSRTGKA